MEKRPSPLPQGALRRLTRQNTLPGIHYKPVYDVPSTKELFSRSL